MDIAQIEVGPFDSNIFLLKDRGKAVLIDTGSGFNNHSVEESVRRELAGDDLRGIVLTHEHFDHSGGAKYLGERFGVPIHGSPECARALREADPNLTGSFLFGAKMEPIMEMLEISKSLDIDGILFEVYSTPGHAPGLICLIEVSGRNLFCGDLVFCDGGVGRWDLPGGNIEQHRNSIERSLQWDVKALYPGHGRVETSDPWREMQKASSMLSFV